MLKPVADGWSKLRGFRVSRIGFALVLAGMISSPGRHGLLKGEGPRMRTTATEDKVARLTHPLPGHPGNDDEVANFVRCLMAKRSVGTGESTEAGSARISIGFHSPADILPNLCSGR
jgi:hypothetical protein